MTPKKKKKKKKGDDLTLPLIHDYSKALNKAEANYSIMEKELLTIKTTLTECRHFHQGAKHKIISISI